MSWRVSGQYKGSDPDAYAYIAAVEQQDNQALENGVKFAISNFVVGCKDDGIWDAIKASCILAGARTLAGALVPLVGTAPTNFNFVSGDYDRKTGLVGDGATKYLDSNRNNNADLQNNRSISAYLTNQATVPSACMGAGTFLTGDSNFGQDSSAGTAFFRLSNATGSNVPGGSTATGLIGASRSVSANFIARIAGSTTTFARASETPSDGNYLIFARNASSPTLFTDARLAFYSIGEALDLAALDTRVSNLMTAIGAAIP